MTDNNGIYEYDDKVKLEGSSSVYFRVPASIILDKDSDDKRVSAFSFFSMRRGFDNTVTFTLNGMAKWLNKKPDRHSGGVNDKLGIETKRLADKGYISLDGKIGNSSEADATFNVDKITEECDSSWFAVIYLDELRKILEYRQSGKDSIKNSDSILLVFAWLRMKIMRRRSKLFPEEVNVDGSNDKYKDIDARKKKAPDAYDCYYYDIANEVGISARTVAKCVDALNDMGLIYSEQLPRTSKDGKWQTNHTVFCNYYKRENGMLLANGKKYYLEEIFNKKKKLGFAT